jgi:hypothetical protein
MDVEKEIKEIKNALLRIEQMLENSRPVKDSTTSKKISRHDKSSDEDFAGATGGIRLLIAKGFFKQRRAMSEVIQALHGEG